MYNIMVTPRASKLRESEIVGLKYFDRLMPLLERLHDVGTERDRAGNRQLFFDQYCAYILLFLFNPIVTSSRGIQPASELKKVQKKLGCPRASLGSLSEATQVSDPEPVKQPTKRTYEMIGFYFIGWADGRNCWHIWPS